MTTLEHMLEHGTDTQKELALLSMDYPTHPESMIEEKLAKNKKSCLRWMTGTALGTTLSAALVHSEMGFLVSVGGIGGLISLGYLAERSSLQEVKKYLHEPHKIVKGFFMEDIPLFYYAQGRFTSSPTAVELMFGKRVYPIGDLKSFNDLTDAQLGYIQGVNIKEQKQTKYTYSDFISGAGSANIDVVQLQVSIEKGDICLEYTFSVREELFDTLYKVFRVNDGNVSLLVEKTRKGIGKIVDSYSYGHVFGGTRLQRQEYIPRF